MFPCLRSAAKTLFVMVAICGFAGGARAASVVNVLPFQLTGSNSPSHAAKGFTPYAELLQASDGNFYGTTVYGGSGPCVDPGVGGIIGCGTVFQINAKTGVETVIYNFPFDTAAGTAPDGAFPNAGLIQGKDGALYGVASDGGIYGQCNGAYGCGTLFRISTTGAFSLLHQFCGSRGCVGVDEGGIPLNHLVQTADGTLYGMTSQGGSLNDGTLFSATTAGVVSTLHYFQHATGDGFTPVAALLVGHDGHTLYGTTKYGGASFYGGTVFSYGAAGYTIIHSFDDVVSAEPLGALIYGADGLLYGTTYGDGNTGGGSLFSLDTTGGAYAVDVIFSAATPAAGLLLGSDGMMYGTLLISPLSGDGSLFGYDPPTKAMQAIVAFTTNTGAAPRGVLIEGSDRYLYGSNSQYGGANSLGQDGGTLYRVGPPLAK